MIDYFCDEYMEIDSFEDHKQWKLVKHKQSGQMYVYKKLQRYHQEVYAFLWKHSHPYIVAVQAYHEEDNVLYVLEEYIEGKSIQNKIDEGHVFSEQETKTIVLMLCDALLHLHNLNPPIIHRDIKPANIILTNDGMLKLIDFDIARVYTPNTSMDTTVLGTQGYAAPEQFGFTQSDERSDIYALGVLMNVMLTTLLPQDFLHQGTFTPHIEKCIYMDPQQRYKNIAELKEDLEGKKRRRKSILMFLWKGFRLIPGFRTLKLWKMLIAILVYGFYIQYFRKNWNIYDATFLLSYLVVFGNVGGIKKYLGFFDSPNRKTRVLGYIVYGLVLFLVYIIAYVNLHQR